ncbi:AraC-like DNA-binding protein/quercetin dioxygenase-like cupin family protein [Paenibacillus sp. SORGH_AS306]|uniref:AraC family transcriptional regulator n=1 Tax=unclassified Paenibacillus TaxID=185978 RepID=UPI00277F95BA|nr:MULTISPECIES: AraC family transcriptional regulator [unclassified Paenibacillus]MDQ1234640.1 AraC-like DNA-binding protein/quercetin dioxygenase-like cupin family protein [Paenibacillus sp. SORGH_AS_0306]MDR6111685.1 AraC-like DNA-binding protein/quercetin dioxygenase-like cupin family protein [Paenibacillus sp. SORGH_AS_0338]
MLHKSFGIDQNLKELTEHRTVLLPFACYENQINQDIHGYIPLHWHEEIQFVVVQKGEALFQINEEQIVVKQGNGLFINSGCLHKAEEVEQSECMYICLNIAPHFILAKELYMNYVSPYIQATNFPHLEIKSTETWGATIIKSIREINESIKQKQTFFEIEISEYITSIWKTILVHGISLEYDQLKFIKSYRMKQMLNWIHLHYTEKIILDDIAKAGQLSRSECCRYFKRILKTTPLHYVIDYRIQKSLVLLQQDESTITEVAYQVGFNSTSYFIDLFRKKMNTTPLAYKKLNL